jgi:amino acid transporter
MSIVVGTMIGTGIFIIPAEMARAAGSVSVVFAAWLVGGALSLFGALAYAELSAALPEAGGEYAFLSRAYGSEVADSFIRVDALHCGLTHLDRHHRRGIRPLLRIFIPCRGGRFHIRCKNSAAVCGRGRTTSG